MTYIVRLTTNYVGLAMINEFSANEYPPADVLRILTPYLKGKLADANTETLGRICACAERKTMLDSSERKYGILFPNTSLEEVQVAFSTRDKTGRDLLQEIAIATIVACVCTIMEDLESE